MVTFDTFEKVSSFKYMNQGQNMKPLQVKCIGQFSVHLNYKTLNPTELLKTKLT